jgi:uncharacterized protein
VPFIARYRKERTGGLDETQIIAIRDRQIQLTKLVDRRAAILRSLEEQGKLTDTLRERLESAATLAELEDIYLPYRPKRRTRGTIAKEKGLEPLAACIFQQDDVDIANEARRFIDSNKAVTTAEEAVAGARDIIAEWVNEHIESRSILRKLFREKAILSSKAAKGKGEAGLKYKDYFDWNERLADAPSHRIMAIMRGTSEGFLTFHILPPEEEAIKLLQRQFVRGDSPSAEQVRMAVNDSYRRLLAPSLENEARVESKARADDAAIKVFAENLRHLLLSPSLGQKSVIGIDPGFRTGCKAVCLDPHGKLLYETTIYPLEPHRQTEKATDVLKQLVDRFKVDAVAVGNGTGGREAEAFCKSIDFCREVPIVMVNESGASVYSASSVAREEFPELDTSKRGAVSIGRRLMDPLAELVKIDAKSIGVGQYQHDVDQKALKRSLDDTVTSCVNAVGVEVNTASKQLLQYVSGLSDRLAGNLVEYRNEHGAFRSRRDLLNVAGMGPRTFELAAGFLRIRDGDNPLDGSAVHPESYSIVEKMADELGCTVTELMGSPEHRASIRIENYVTETFGIPTLTDIMTELEKPGRDPRKSFESVEFADEVREITDLAVGMRLVGVVTNVTAFGAFVDIGVHQDGLVHISELADRFIRDPHEAVTVHQRVVTTVIGVDTVRNRISLSLRRDPFTARGKPETDRDRRKADRAPKRKKRGTPRQQKQPPRSDSPFAELWRALDKPKESG